MFLNRALLGPILLSLCFVASAQDVRVPRITSVFTPPPKAKPSDDSANLGPFTTGPKPAEVDDATKAKLEGLAKQYGEVARANFGLIIKTLQVKPAKKSKPVRIVVTYGYGGVAATSGAGFGSDPKTPVIEVSAKYALAHPDDLGMIVHEMVHVVQSYPKYDPVWLVEGIADYVRWFYYEPADKRPHPNPAKVTARDSYRTTGAFLFWASNKYDVNLVPKLNAALTTNTYQESMFKDSTGKTLDELNLEWLDSLKAQTH